ncbi:MAG: DNA cytosine methyltransferase [Candidatus Electrothrix aestuarii]|uniref:Cytosine-specific methyltransferase n=1 Tax=Candidatus Electrothrix aestuarii TaxID=3062594 RepID=A0AAU8LXR7_9BACT|nr:DNA cytosine methyltransferase [Candidatus Electrothrix aestuarii]
MQSTFVDIKKASELLKITPQQVRNLCRSKKLPSEKVSGSWVMYEHDIYNYYDNSSCGIAENQSSYYTNEELLSKTKPIALSFFSGAMGLDLGLEKAGFEVLLSCEIDNACRKTIIKNKPQIALIDDINNYTAEEIRELAKLAPNDDIDLVVGGPPCQAFSTAGKRKGLDDKRGNVFLKFLEVAIELAPKFIVIENVRGLLSAPLKHRPHNQRGTGFKPLTPEEKEKGGVLFHVLQKLRKAGYGVNFNLYNSANFGTPQKRERVVVVCSRDGKKLPYLVPTNSEKELFGLPKWRSFKEAMNGAKIDKHHHLEFPEKRLKYYRKLKAGQYWKHLPTELQKEALGKSYYAGGGKTGFLRRLSWDAPSPTLVTHPAMPATDLAHPTEDRPLSVEEYKKIQEFPDSWQIEGSLIEQYKQIGNAVPRSLGTAIGKLLIDYMNNREIKVYEDFNYSRYKNTDEIKWEKEFLKRCNTRTLPLEKF